jgi:superoxide dismutase, Fe-Mn family
MNKRDFLKGAAAVTAAGALSTTSYASSLLNVSLAINDLNTAVNNSTGKYVLPDLKYAKNALEPYIDAQTVTLHHDIHHLGYVNGLNRATEKIKESGETGDFTLIKFWEKELAFHGAGHFLHVIYWNVMNPKQGNRSAELNKYINKSFGSFDKFMSIFKAASVAVEGSGWGIVSYEPYSDSLIIQQAELHQNLTQWVQVPLIPIDVWEHAYYLKYQNRRGEYVDGFFKLIDWEYVSEQFEKVLSMYK